MEERLKEIGLSEDQISKVKEEFKKSLDGNYVTKEVFNEKNNELKKAKEEIASRDTQIQELGKYSQDNEDLKNKLELIRRENEEAKANYEKELAKEKLIGRVRNEISNDKDYKAHDVDLVLSQLNMENIKFENETLIGFKEQFDNLKNEKGFLFNKVEQNADKGKFIGVKPNESQQAEVKANASAIARAKELAQRKLVENGISINKE